MSRILIYNWANEPIVFSYLDKMGLKNDSVIEGDIGEEVKKILAAGLNALSAQGNCIDYDVLLYIDSKRFSQR